MFLIVFAPRRLFIISVNLFMSLDLAYFLIFSLFSFLRRLLWVFSSTVVGPDHDLDPESHSCECRRSFSMSWSCDNIVCNSPLKPFKLSTSFSLPFFTLEALSSSNLSLL